MKYKAADAPITFEEIIMVMINFVIASVSLNRLIRRLKTIRHITIYHK